MVILRRRLRSAWCVLTGGHRFWWPQRREPYALAACCQRCGHESVLDLSDLVRPIPYHGVPVRRRVR